MRKVPVLSVMVWSDHDEDATRAFLQKYTRRIQGMAVPIKAERPLNAHTVAHDDYGQLYPKARNRTDGYFGEESFLSAFDEK